MKGGHTLEAGNFGLKVCLIIKSRLTCTKFTWEEFHHSFWLNSKISPIFPGWQVLCGFSAAKSLWVPIPVRISRDPWPQCFYFALPSIPFSLAGAYGCMGDDKGTCQLHSIQGATTTFYPIISVSVLLQCESNFSIVSSFNPCHLEDIGVSLLKAGDAFVLWGWWSSATLPRRW